MQKYIITISYDGRNYRGWQRQKNTPKTIQDHLSQLITRAFNQSVDLQGASRTDAGVHALGQVAMFELQTKLSPEAIKQTINQYLPEDIAVLDCQIVPPEFHVRHTVVDKTYRYTLYISDKPDVFFKHLEWAVSGPLNINRMKQAAEVLIGKHDFAGFTVGRQKKTTRTIQSIDLQLSDTGRIIIDITGDGFLHHMIRLIVGTLVEVGRGGLPVDHLEKILREKDRSQAILAPPHGLCLMQVNYNREET